MKPLLIVDGYNIIGAWKEASRAGWSIDACRDKLLHQLQDHSGYSGEEVVLVFDGYQSDRRVRTEELFGGVTQVFTMHGETADSYIERLVATTPGYRVVRVATSDGLEQSQVLSTGATRLTARELLIELKDARSKGLSAHEAQVMGKKKRSIAGRLSEDMLAELERMRRG